MNEPTVCVLCSHNCGIRVDVEGGKIVRVRGDDSNPITKGYVCNKAFSVARYADHDQRVRHPLRRRPDGTFERVRWDRAIADIAASLAGIRRRHGGRAIGLVGIGGQANHLDGAYGLSFLRGVGSRRWFNAFAQEKTQHCLLDQWMCDATPSAFLHPDDHNTRYLLVLGTNPRISNRGHNATETFRDLARDPARKVVVVDPRVTETARGADIHLEVRPGSDCYLMLGLAAVIVARGLCDQAFVRDRTRDYDTIANALGRIDPVEMAGRCGIGLDDLERVAIGFASTRPAAILNDLGVEQIPFSTLNAYLIRLLLALTGNLGRAGGNVYYQAFNPPDPRGLERGETETALVSGIAAIRALGSYGMFSPSLVPEEVLSDHPERLRALIVEGSNPLLSYSDTSRWREAIERLDLLVVIDPAMTETALAADYVLPTPVGYEKWEISGFPKHWPVIHTQVRPPVLLPPPDALPEAEIYARLAEAMDLFGEPPRVLKLLARAGNTTPGRAAMLVVATAAARLARRGGVQSRVIFWLYRALGPSLPAPALVAVWLICFKNATMRRRAVLRVLGTRWEWRSPFAITDELFRRVIDHPEGVAIAKLSTEDNLGDHIGFDDGRVRLAPGPMIAEITRALDQPRQPPADYPLILAAGVRTAWTANTIHRDPGWRKGKGPHCTVRIHPDDAANAGLQNGAAARLETRRGAVTLPATFDPTLRPGFITVPNGFGAKSGDSEVVGVNLNELTAADDRDPFTGCPHHKHVPCRVRPA